MMGRYTDNDSDAVREKDRERNERKPIRSFLRP